MRKIGIGMVLGLLAAGPATAGFEESLQALRANDYVTGLAEARKGAAAGDARAAYLVYVALTATALRYLDAGGKPDMDKYFKLAARPPAERSLDVEAYDALYRAASAGVPPAVAGLAMLEGGTLGEDNRVRMLSLLKSLPPETRQKLASYERIAQQMERLGQSYATPQLFADTLRSQEMTAALKACGMQQAAAGKAVVVATAITTPPHDTVYLPSAVAGFEHAYLIAGQWREEWTFQACGKTVLLQIAFSADGLGGATMTSSMRAGEISN